MPNSDKKIELFKALAWFSFCVLMVFLIIPKYIAPLIWPDDSSKKRDHFYSTGFAGKITSVDDGRGLKISIDNHQSYLEPVGYYCLNCKTDFIFETGENLGDSLVKKVNTETFYLKKSNGKELIFEMVNKSLAKKSHP